MSGHPPIPSNDACLENRMATHPTLRIIREEHATLAAVLKSMDLLLAEARKRKAALGEREFRALRAMLYYIDAFPETEHHPKEHDVLFARLRQRTHEIDAVLDRLDREHGLSQARVRDLEHAVLGLEMMEGAADAEARRVRFDQLVADYIDHYLAHMRTEEEQVLPEAERVFTAADWAAVDAAFTKNRDPLTLREADDRFRPLFKRILMTLPPPLGIGPASLSS